MAREAARKLNCTIRELFVRASNGVQVLVADLRRIPKHVMAYIRKVLGPKVQPRRRVRERQRYRRMGPAMVVH